MGNAIVIINAGDIPPAIQIAKGLPSYTVFIFDPVLFDQVADSGLKNIELISWDNCPLYAELVADARASASALEAELDLAIRNIVPDVSIVAWQHLNLYYLFMMLKWYTGLWYELGNRLAGAKAHIFICDNPATYYFNSFIPSLLLLLHLKHHDIEFSAYTYAGSTDVSLLVPDLSGKDEDVHTEQILTHMPTCMYDMDYFHQEITAAGKPIINIEAKHWNIPVPAQKTLSLVNANDVFPSLADSLRETITAFSQRVMETLDRCLAPYLIASSYRERQVKHLGTLYRCQLLTYYQLNRHFEFTKPSKLLLSDHDAGFHGPLVSFAERHNIPVLLVPHSKVGNDCEFSYGNITSLTHPIQGEGLVNGHGKRLLNFYLSYPEKFSSNSAMPSPLKKIGLLLNGLALNGITCTGLAVYIDGIKRMDHWCKQHGIELIVRSRPNQTLIELLDEAIGVERANMRAVLTGSLQAFVESIDLCLMYDAPTSAVIEFLRTGIPVLNPIPDLLSKAEAQWANSQVVPRTSVDGTLEMLDSFIADDSNLHVFHTNQFSDYVGLFRQSYALRRFL